jgi:hypothetical protein
VSAAAVCVQQGLVVLLKTTCWLMWLLGIVSLLIGSMAAAHEGNLAIALVFGVTALLCLGLVWGD